MVGFDSAFLLRMRREALRKGVWFKVLDSAERAILNLVPMCMEKPRSLKLIDIVAKIVVKIKTALKSQILDLVSQVGRPLARKLSCIAQKWGHKTADKWVNDARFWRFLTIVYVNDVPGSMSKRKINGCLQRC
jgi:hypothetical protein